MQASLTVFDQLKYRDARAVFLSSGQELAIAAEGELLARLEKVFACAANHFPIAGVLLSEHEHWGLSDGFRAEFLVVEADRAQLVEEDVRVAGFLLSFFKELVKVFLLIYSTAQDSSQTLYSFITLYNLQLKILIVPSWLGSE